MYYAYVVEGLKDEHSNVGLKVGQTQNFDIRLKQLNIKGIVEPKLLFECETREDAEVIESLLRRYYIKHCKGLRVGNDWIEKIPFNSNIIRHKEFVAFLNMLNIKTVITFKKITDFKKIQRKIL